MRSWDRWAAILLAVTGAAVCLVALFGFVATVNHNNLSWKADQSIRDHYLAVGDSYSQGFTVGFFLCFFLILIAVSARSLMNRQSRVGETTRGRRGPARPVPTR